MNRIWPLIFCVFIIPFQSCNKKAHPNSTVANTRTNSDTLAVIKKSDSVSAIKPVVKRKSKGSTPKVIVVNDKFANKSVDGRYYYDLQGHRYWRNNKDGKYYLFNKAMLTDEAFKKPD